MNHVAWEFSPCLRDRTIPHVSGKSLRRWPENLRVLELFFTVTRQGSADPSEPMERWTLDQAPESAPLSPWVRLELIILACPHWLSCLLGLASVLIRKRLLPWRLHVNKAICDLINPDGQVCPFLPSPLYWVWMSFSPCRGQCPPVADRDLLLLLPPPFL